MMRQSLVLQSPLATLFLMCFRILRPLCFSCLVCLVGTPLVSADDYSPAIEPASDEGQLAIENFRIPEGMEARLWAAEPMLANPVAFGIDDRGRIYVCETFRQSKGVEDNRGHMNWLEADLALTDVEQRREMFELFLGADVQDYTKEQDRLRLLEDTDGDGRVDLKSSAPDALMSGANMLRALGWRAGEPWLQEVRLPAGLDWSLTGPAQTRTVAEWAAMGVSGRNEPLANGSLPAAILLPQGRHGPAFIAYPNFGVYFDWNQSFVYVLTAAYFATRLEGAPVYDAGNPDPGLSGEEMKRLQTRLMALGHDVGGIDGILGAKTRDAVQAEQARLGLPADAWPTRELLNRL